VRAAFRRDLAERIKKTLTRADEFQRIGSKRREYELETVRGIVQMLSEDGLYGKKVQFDACIERKENKGKRRTLRNFPDDWREMIFDASAQRLKRSVAVLALTGCRPDELKKGISVSESESGNGIIFTINGSKTNNGHGQPKRTLTIERTEQNAKFFDAIQAGEIQEDDGYIRVSLNRISKKLWPNRKSIISAYSFRHQMASDLKKNGIDSVELALRLGHSVTKTQSMYGQANQGRSGGLVGGQVYTTGSRKVKENRRLPQKLREEDPGLSLGM
jgi:integrase